MSTLTFRISFNGSAPYEIVAPNSSRSDIWAETYSKVEDFAIGSHEYYKEIATSIGNILPARKDETPSEWIIRALMEPGVSQIIRNTQFPEYWVEEAGKLKIGSRAIFGGASTPYQDPSRPRSVWTNFRKSLGYHVENRKSSYKWVWDVLSKLRILPPAPVRITDDRYWFYDGTITSDPFDDSPYYHDGEYMCPPAAAHSAAAPIIPAVAGDD